MTSASATAFGGDNLVVATVDRRPPQDPAVGDPDAMRDVLVVRVPGEPAGWEVDFGSGGAPLALRVADVLRDVALAVARRAPRVAATAEAADYPKLDHVSFYAKTDRGGRPRWRVTYRIPGYRRRTDRLGVDGRRAYKFAQTVSDVLEHVRNKLLSPGDAFRRLCVDRRPIREHADAYDKALKTKGVNEDYRKSTIHRVRESLETGGITRYDQLTEAAVERVLERLVERETAEGSGKVISGRTVNYYLRALRQFTKWMAKSKRATHDPLQYATGVEAEEERRRDATPADVTALYAVAMADGRTRAGAMRGPDRAMLYLYAACTGLRQSELAAARVDWLRLGGDRPTLTIPGEHTKNGKPADQPVPAWLASATVDWLGARKAGPLFPTMPQDIIRPFDRDRKAAELPKRTAEGVMVFHSLRHGYASTLLESDAEAKLVQSLTRHSTITLLFDRYGHARRGKAHAAVERAMPDLRPPSAVPAAPATSALLTHGQAGDAGGADTGPSG